MGPRRRLLACCLIAIVTSIQLLPCPACSGAFQGHRDGNTAISSMLAGCPCCGESSLSVEANRESDGHQKKQDDCPHCHRYVVQPPLVALHDLIPPRPILLIENPGCSGRLHSPVWRHSNLPLPVDWGIRLQM